MSSLFLSLPGSHLRLHGLRMSKDVAVIQSDTVTCGSAPSSNPSSPKNRVKFLCSHGGKILPRPTDGHLKYVGRETRVISVPRDFPFRELMKKLTYSIDGEMILKYQMLSQDLDTLISVKSDEDAGHMFDEIDRHETMGAPWLRTFIFPANPIVAENHSTDAHIFEQRYIDAINGIILPQPLPMKHQSTINTVQHGSLLPSACSSPRSPDSYTNNEAMNESNQQSNRLNMHRVRSSPTLCSLNAPQQSNYQNIHQLPPQYYYRQSPKPAIDHYKSVVAPERPSSVLSAGRGEGMRYQVDPAPQYYYSGSNSFMDRRMVNRMGSPAISPRDEGT